MIQVEVSPVVLGAGRKPSCRWKGRKEITRLGAPDFLRFPSPRTTNIVAASKSPFHSTSRSKAHDRGKRVAPQDIFTFSHRFRTDVPLHETSGVSMDEYLNDEARIVQAIFPDQRHRTRISDKEWKLQMIPVKFLFLSASPVVFMHFVSTSKREEYPATVPTNATRVLDIKATDCGLVGLDGSAMPSHLALTVQGALYPHRDHGHSNLKGNVEITIGFDLPPVLALMPQHIIRGVGETVLKHLAAQMKHDFDTGLAADFKRFRREKLLESEAARTSSNAEKQTGAAGKSPKKRT